MRDSAGIRIVENERAAWTDDTRWRIADAPSVDIGGGDSATASLLYQVVTARRLSDGRIAIANTGTAEVRVFDSTGKHLSTVGRRGQGPGEFGAPWRITGLPGDSLLVVDIARGFQFNLFAPSGAFVRSYTTPVARRAEGTQLVDWFPDGSSLVERHEFESRERQPGTPVRGYVSLFRLAADGAMLDSLGRFENQTGMAGVLYLWGPWGHEAVHDSSVYHGAGDSYEIRRYSVQGDLRAIIRRSLPNTPTTREHFDAFVNESLQRLSTEEGGARMRPALEQRFASARYAPYFPAYFHLRTDQPGNLWVQEYTPRVGEGRVWSVFDPAGIYLGDVEMPERFRLFQIGDDFVLGQWRDGDDVEHVRVYPIIKPD